MYSMDSLCPFCLHKISYTNALGIPEFYKRILNFSVSLNGSLEINCINNSLLA